MPPKFERRGEVDYVIREGITTDDPVGAYILKRFDDNPKGVTRMSKGGKAVYYSELLDLFESGNMPRATYESIEARIAHTNTPLAVLTERREINSFKDSALAKLVFGEGDMPLEDLGLSDTLKDVVCGYVLKAVEECPDLYNHRDRLRAAAESRNFQKLEKAVLNYGNSILFEMRQRDFFNFLRWSGNEDLLRDFYGSQKKGFFEMAKVYAAIVERAKKV